MEQLNFNQKKILFRYNDKEIVKPPSKDKFRPGYTENDLKKELHNAFKVVAGIINQRKRLNNTPWFDRIRCTCLSSSVISEENQLSSPNESEDLIDLNDIENVYVDVEMKDEKTVLVQIKILKDPTKKGIWFKEAVSYYYGKIVLRPRNSTIIALIEKVPPI